MTEAREFICDICAGPLVQQRWRGFPPVCSKCEMESIHDTPGLSGPYLDSYNRLRDLRNALAEVFRLLEAESEEIIEGEPIPEIIEQIVDLTDTFRESVIKPLDYWVAESAPSL